MNDTAMFQSTFLMPGGIQAFICFLWGAGLCFTGKKYFRLWMAAGMAYIGLLAGITISGHLWINTLGNWLIGLVAGILGGLFGYFAPYAGLVFTTGLTVADIMTIFGNLDTRIRVGLVTVSLVMAFFFVLFLRHKIVIPLSALTGSALFTMAAFAMIQISNLAMIRIAWGACTFLLWLIGVIIQKLPLNNKSIKRKA